MEFMTGYYRQKEETTALLLQQYVCSSVPVFLGCICGGRGSGAGMAGGSFTGRLLEEFRRFSLLQAVKKGERFLGRMERRVYQCWKDSGDLPDFWTAGILCVGECFLLFSGGPAKRILCNTGFGRPVLQEIRDGERAEPSRLQVQWGSMETGIGILLASESFCREISREDMQSCLAVKDIADPGQTQKRVQELGSAAERRGGRGMAALLLEVR